MNIVTRDPTTQRGYDTTDYDRRRNMIASRLLLLTLRRLHYEHAPEDYKDRFLPSTIVGDPLLELGRKLTQKKVVPLKAAAQFNAKTQIATILAVVARYYDVEISKIVGARSTNKYIRPRQVAMYLATELTAISFPAIGNELNKDHTTVMHGHRVTEARMKKDPVLAIQIETIKAHLGEWTKPATYERQVYRSMLWTPDRIKRLMEMREQRIAWTKIAEEIGLSVGGCQHQYRRVLKNSALFEGLVS